MRIESFRSRMTIGFVIAISGLAIALCAGWQFYSRHSAELQAQTTLSAAASRLKTELTRKSGEARTAELIEEEQDLLYEGIAVTVYDPNGMVIQASPARGPQLPPHPDGNWRTFGFDSEIGHVALGMRWDGTETSLRKQALALITLCLFVVVTSSIGAWLLVGKTLTPIAKLSQQANSASVQDLRVRLASPSGDAEVVELVGTLNGLLERLAEGAAAKGRFYAAASHELRTPLQAMSGHLELAIARPRSNSEYRVIVAEALKQTRRLISLSQDLLTLHRIETSAGPAISEPVDLSDICSRLLASSGSQAQNRDLTLRSEIANGVEIEAQPGHIEMLVRNLLDNAVKYSRPGSEVNVELDDTATCPYLRISNVHQLAEDVEPGRWLAPFDRPDASRSSSTGGNGLGLAICKAIADANDWKLDVHREGERVVAVVWFGINLGHAI